MALRPFEQMDGNRWEAAPWGWKEFQNASILLTAFNVCTPSGEELRRMLSKGVCVLILSVLNS